MGRACASTRLRPRVLPRQCVDETEAKRRVRALYPRRKTGLGMQGLVVALLVALVLLSAAPFPHWPAYRRLWQAVLFERQRELGFRVRLRQAWLLLRKLFLSPVFSLLWWVDEILFPAYRRVEIVEPIFILGQARCGTSYLHRLLAEHQDLVAVRHFEWRYPFLVLLVPLRRLGLLKLLANRNYWPENDAGRVASKMHADSLKHWEEEGIFFEEVFLQHFFLFRRFPYTGCARSVGTFECLSERQKRYLTKIHRKALQKVLFYRGQNRRLVLKENESLELLASWMELLPDARWVSLVRQPHDFAASFMHLSRMSTWAKVGVDPYEIAGWKEANMAKRVEECRLHAKAFEATISAERQVRLFYRALFEDIAGTGEALCRRLGVRATPAFTAHLARQDEKQAHRTSGYVVPELEVPELRFFEDFVQESARRHRAMLGQAQRRAASSLQHATLPERRSDRAGAAPCGSI